MTEGKSGWTLGVKEVILIFALAGALYGGIEGISVIAHKEAVTEIKEYKLEAQEEIGQIKTQQAIIKEKLTGVEEKVNKIDENVQKLVDAR